jgi:hypothetical protein
MLKFLKDKLAARSLARKQLAVARELQAVFDARLRLNAHELYLTRYAAQLRMLEINSLVSARRTHQEQAGA